MIVDSILVRKLTRGDFWNMERRINPTSGGGQSFIDLPLGNITFPELADFLNVPVTNIENLEEVSIEVKPIGIGEASNLNFASRGGANNTRYRITNQNIYRPTNQRPDGWKEMNGFPTLPDTIIDTNSIPSELHENIRIFIIKTIDSQYFSGYINNSTIPQEWQNIQNLNEVFNVSSCNITTFQNSKLFQYPEIIEIFEGWKKKPNILLYGPPGTGKTHIMKTLWESLIDNTLPSETIKINPNNQGNPFYKEDHSYPFKTPIIQKWLTFHQNYNYENFILATKPIPTNASFELKPYAGSLLTSAILIDQNIQSEYSNIDTNKTAIIFIDELNRGNVSRIFGEFITFMDFDYRDSSESTPLPVPLNNINNISPTKTEEITLENGIKISLTLPWFFPKNIYILASMNSVDKAVAPLDSALSRRFHKINIFPNMEELANHLNITNPLNLLQVNNASSRTSNIKAEEVAWLLLYRLNYELASILGKDYELGQSYLYNLKNLNTDSEKYKELAKIWDTQIYPQLQERFSNRGQEILNILRLNDNVPEEYLFKQKIKPLSPSISHRNESPWTLKSISLYKEFSNNSEQVINTLKYLAGLPS